MDWLNLKDLMSNRLVLAVAAAGSALSVGYYLGCRQACTRLSGSRLKAVFGKNTTVQEERERTVMDYVMKHTNEHPVLGELREETSRHSRFMMMCSPEQSRLLALLVKLIGGKKCLEIGVFTGYNTLSIALAMEDDGKVVACDVNREYTDIGSRFWEKAGVLHKIDLRIQPALTTLDKLIANGESGTFDFAFIDADKENMTAYYEKSLQLVRQGGIIALDNMLWSGNVVDESKQDGDTVEIRKVADYVGKDTRVDSSFLNVGDGLQLAVKL